MITVKKCATHYVEIYMSGPIDVIYQTCRSVCTKEGLCVTVTPTRYIYTGGEEEGVIIGLLNYPRFPCTQAELYDKGVALAHLLLDESHQHSVLLKTALETTWISRREHK
mgnify:CR=1 FL=1|tara:strand:- start:1490 stop:1819 length:330 start_codon:yes stop_codon:yes gene_type:complete